MKVFVSFDGDHIGRMVGRASLADKPEEVSRIAQSIERGNAIWQSWAESHGGKVINIGGDEGRLEVEADHLEELPKIRDQYQQCVGSTVSVGVGTKLSEADKSLMAAKLQGGDRIQLFTETVNELLEELQEKPEGEKLFEEYLDPDTGLQKAQLGMNAGTNAGFAGASMSHPAAPAQPTEGSEHSEAEVARGVLGIEPGQPVDYEQMFHQAAAQTPEEPDQQPSGLQDGVRAQVIQILQDVRSKADKLEEMRATNPDLYESVKGLVQAMISMAQAQGGPTQPEQGMQKAEGKVGQCKWKLGERRCQRIVTGNYCHSHKDHWANKIAEREEREALNKGDVVQLNPPPPTGKKFRANAEVVPLATDANSRWDAPGEAINNKVVDPQARARAVAGAVPNYQQPVLSAPGIGGAHNIYDYSHMLSPESQALGHRLMVRHSPGKFDDYMSAEILDHQGQRVNHGFAYPTNVPIDPPGGIHAALTNHAAWVRFGGGALQKAWPKDDATNQANANASLDNPATQDDVLDRTGASKQVTSERPYPGVLHSERAAQDAALVSKIRGSRPGKFGPQARDRDYTRDLVNQNPQSMAQVDANAPRRAGAVEDGRDLNTERRNRRYGNTDFRGIDNEAFAEEIQNQPEFDIPDIDLPHASAAFSWSRPTAGATWYDHTNPNATGWLIAEHGSGRTRYWHAGKDGSVTPAWGHGPENRVPARDNAIQQHLQQHLAANPNVYKAELMPGGKGDGKPDSNFDADQLKAGTTREMEEHGLDEARAREVAKDHLTEDPRYYSLDKAALQAGKTGRHQVVLPVGAQIDSGPSADHEAGKLKVRNPEDGKTKWRSVRAGVVMAPDGTPTSSRNPGG